MAALAVLVGGSFILTLLVFCIVVAVCYYVVSQLLPEPIRKVAIVVLVVMCVLWLLSMLGVQLP